ncbi:outer membrane lipid asymmetry maintenance protein MlaD [Tistrella mobilis]|uniref:ABC superfamily ATP binding cassette transporter substrate binding protein n=1 Tax=Tistrella mobilis (strain KA081020-065) TaxID=1110502 RepID=I3TX61_TISMK|nr:outer membrane lipid asymmetry maintenance protein MlaD [Tistrella mobilis]AFK57349.1 ABC superfamily ATP binding cassette transporter substrate binding protein [Tistrella mobilis KA081020-065]
MQRSVVETLLGAAVIAVAVGFAVHAYTGAGRGGSGSGYALTAAFDSVDGIVPGSEVRIGGIKVGSVTGQHLNPETYRAEITLSIDPTIKLPADSSAEIASSGLLGDKYVSVVPGGDDRMLQPGQAITYTQSSVSLESLIGRYLFSSGGSGEEKPAGAEAPAAGGAAKKDPFAE